MNFCQETEETKLFSFKVGFWWWQQIYLRVLWWPDFMLTDEKSSLDR